MTHRFVAAVTISLALGACGEAVQQGPQAEEPNKEAAATTLSARIIQMQVIGGSTRITLDLGTSAGAVVGMRGQIVDVPSGTFTLAKCNERTCTATVTATLDQIKRSGSVVLMP